MPGGRPKVTPDERWRREKRRIKNSKDLLRYHTKHRALILILGGKCAKCGKTKNLHVDHPDGREYEARKLSPHARVNQYWREYLGGVRLQALCRKCNGHGGYRFAQMAEDAERLADYEAELE